MSSRQAHAYPVGSRPKVPWFARFYYAPILVYLMCCGFFVFAIDTPLDENSVILDWELYSIALPLAFLVFWEAYRHRDYLRQHVGKKRRMPIFFIAFFTYTVVFACSMGWVLAINALGIHSAPMRFYGQVISKEAHRGSRGGVTFILVVDEQSQHRTRRFSVDESLYEEAQIGDVYETTMRIGRLGVPFR
jgi:hypothetical protein